MMEGSANVVTNSASEEALAVEAAKELGNQPTFLSNDDTADDVQAAVKESRDRVSDRETFDRSREHREELAWRYPETKIGDLLKAFAARHSDFQKNPGQAADRLARHYLAQPPRLAKPKPVERAQPPDHLDVHGREEWQREQDARDAYRHAGNERAEAEQYTATAEDRAFLKKAFPHLTFDQACERIAALDADLTADPLGAAAKLAASFGMPITEMHQQELRGAAESQQAVIQLQDGLERVIASGKLPGIENMLDTVAEVLESADFRRSGEIGADLESAYRVALQKVTRQREQAIVDRAKAASGMDSPAGKKPSSDRVKSESANPRSRWEEDRDDVDEDVRAALRKSAA